MPSALRNRVGEILATTDGFCFQHLDAEYASLCGRLVTKLARKRPSPLVTGNVRVWAAGAIYAVGANNLLFDPNEAPHLSADELSTLLGVPKSAIAAKAKRIRDILRLTVQTHAEFCRREVLEDHPFAWLVQVDSIIVDARALPTELQDEARRRGLIPNLPPCEGT